MKQFLLSFLLLIICAVASAAQGNPEQAAKNAREQFSDIKNRSIELERTKRTANQRVASRDSTRNFPQIKEDFETIQKINSDVLQTFATKPSLDYVKISKSAANINRRAVRLKANLFATESNGENVKDKKRVAEESQSVQMLLESLDKSINSFVHNPIFQNTNLVNPIDSLKAQNDLEVLIKISSQIKSSAMRMAKSSVKNND